eukprot:CAMPEP_0172445032 /NCGR_PEP_ID=MMETSP1065-20121228/5017_1 /TAXON_ID=265537 /ORGANISM="Amphiprora paludosa, Strain CCMP125" /LENGTH=1149 /DNA_ID=CAMNT_0013195825 /DNA_START=38 /DNA_END=3487 /DNA_ORIENTATION=-
MSKAATATVLGFGGRAPPVVLEVVSQAVHQSGVKQVIPQRSSSIELALAKAPYRAFLEYTSSVAKEGNGDATESGKDLLVYCLPSSWAEYVATAATEAAKVRSVLLSFDTSATTVVAVYDSAQDKILGGADVLAALGGDVTAQQTLAMAALSALTALDQKAIPKMGVDDRDVAIVVGGGGREHAIAVALAKSPLVSKVLVSPGNGGTAKEGGKIENVVGGKQDNASIIALAKETKAKLVAVGPEAPLVDGIVDALAVECPDVLVFGPTQAAAELEASKAFSKDFLQEHGIPTAKYRNFTDVNEALAYVESLDIANDRQVIKASGLAAGKGVLLPTTKEETLLAVKEIMSDKAFGAAGDTCVVESFLTGPEASCFAFCDGKTAKLMPAAQDHKRALDNDEGLNTGGMGAYAPAPCVTPDLQEEIEAMCQKTVEKMAARGTPYIGLLYAGMMLTPNGPYVLEFNCRFGDPETQAVLQLLETDLYEVMTACCTGTLDQIDIRFRPNTAAATVVCAAKGYPEKYPKGMEITGLNEAGALEGVKVYHAGTKLDSSTTRCSGGRVIAVTGMGTTLKSALQVAYKGVEKIDFVDDSKPGESFMHRRTDIGKKAVQKKMRIGVLGSTRGTALIPVMEACADGSLNAEIVAVVSNKASAPILDKGRSLGKTVTVKAISAKGLTREQFDAECTSVLVAAGVEFVLLVGYMRILSVPFCRFWVGRCINVHPSLLPRHAGGMDLAVHQAVIDAREKESGCTIHQVTETVDGGPIVVQKRVSVAEGDTAESLKAKIQPLEGIAFVEAIQMFSKGEVISYADAGVSIDAGNKLVDLIKPFCKATRRAGCDADLGGFGGLFDISAAGYNASETVLIGATDGVGTKLRIAHSVKKHDTVGIDLVAMCVNDLIVAGGEPLFFLDYFATGHLELEEAASVVKGIAAGCEQAGCGLIGGETAEMPSMYAPGDYDLAGFSVGAVQKSAILPQNVQAGDVLLGLTSSGIHSNGFSLVRKLIEREGLSYSSPCPWDSSVSTIGESLLTPTKIYVKSCLPLLKQKIVKGMAHITGGGLLENLPRSLPAGVGAQITGHPPLPPVFKWLKEASGLDDTEMLRTFNCGIGMVLIVEKANVDKAVSLLKTHGEIEVIDLGHLVEGAKEVAVNGQLG